MLLPVTIVLLNIVCMSCVGDIVNSNENDKDVFVAFNVQKISSDVFTNYSKDVVPQKYTTRAVLVNMTFHIRNIISLDETTEILTFCGWLRISWHDFRLVWDESQYGGISQVYSSREKTWIPDFVSDNTATQYKVLGRGDDILDVSSTGLVVWSPGDIFQTRCSLDVTYFPFDNQTCQVTFITWNYQQNSVQINSLHTPGPSTLWMKHGEWEVTHLTAETHTHPFVPNAVITISMQRQSTFYVFNIILPMVVTTFLNAFVFILPAECGEKITLATALFLSYAVFLGSITDNMPNTSTTASILGIFVATQLVLSAVAILCTVIRLKFYHQGGNSTQLVKNSDSGLFQKVEPLP